MTFVEIKTSLSAICPSYEHTQTVTFCRPLPIFFLHIVDMPRDVSDMPYAMVFPAMSKVHFVVDIIVYFFTMRNSTTVNYGNS